MLKHLGESFLFKAGGAFLLELKIVYFVYIETLSLIFCY